MTSEPVLEVVKSLRTSQRHMLRALQLHHQSRDICYELFSCTTRGAIITASTHTRLWYQLQQQQQEKQLKQQQEKQLKRHDNDVQHLYLTELVGVSDSQRHQSLQIAS
jgi:hypothetical protein